VVQDRLKRWSSMSGHGCSVPKKRLTCCQYHKLKSVRHFPLTLTQIG
jgi:hypothetical protein